MFYLIMYSAFKVGYLQKECKELVKAFFLRKNWNKMTYHQFYTYNLKNQSISKTFL